MSFNNSDFWKQISKLNAGKTHISHEALRVGATGSAFDIQKSAFGAAILGILTYIFCIRMFKILYMRSERLQVVIIDKESTFDIL